MLDSPTVTDMGSPLFVTHVAFYGVVGLPDNAFVRVRALGGFCTTASASRAAQSTITADPSGGLVRCVHIIAGVCFHRRRLQFSDFDFADGEDISTTTEVSTLIRDGSVYITRF